MPYRDGVLYNAYYNGQLIWPKSIPDNALGFQFVNGGYDNQHDDPQYHDNGTITIRFNTTSDVLKASTDLGTTWFNVVDAQVVTSQNKWPILFSAYLGGGAVGANLFRKNTTGWSFSGFYRMFGKLESVLTKAKQTSGYTFLSTFATANRCVCAWDTTARLLYQTISTDNIGACACLGRIFENCTNLRYPFKSITVDIRNVNAGCANAFVNCTGLLKFPNVIEIGNTINMTARFFEGCTSVVNATNCRFYTSTIKNNATSQFRDFFTNCTNLEYGPTVGPRYSVNTPTSDDSAFQNMFSGCIKLKSLAVNNFTAWTGTYSTTFNNWMLNVPTTNACKFWKPPTLPDQRGVSRIPNNWRVGDIANYDPNNPLA